MAHQCYPLLLLLIVPMLGAIYGSTLRSAKAAKNWALLVSFITLGVGVWLACNFYAAPKLAGHVLGNPGANPIYNHVPVEFGGGTFFGIDEIGFHFHLGVDGISLWLVLLTVFLTPLAIASSFESIKERQKEYYAWMQALLAAMIGVFIARDLLLFYIFFELTLIPMFFIIGVWGGPERRYAAGKFFLFTFTGSVFTLAAVIYLGLRPGSGMGPSFDIFDVVRYGQSLALSTRIWIVAGLLAGFAVKVPLFPVHTWLPLAHTEAPTAGSVILAGVLLKLGTYGFLRLAMPIGFVSGMINNNVQVAFPLVLKFLAALCIIGIIYAALAAWVQRDIKKLVAYSSVSHLGFCVLGLLALNTIGMQGSVLYMINHGLSTGALFLVVGMIYDRYHTRDINELSGLARKMPVLAFFFVFFAMSSIGLPGLNGFVSEFLTVLGAFTSTALGARFGTLAAIGVILGAIYMLHMVARVIWGPLKTPALDAHGHAGSAAHGAGAHAPGDLGRREIGILIPLAIAVLVLGVQPNLIMDSFREPLQTIRTPLPALNSSVANGTRTATQRIATDNASPVPLTGSTALGAGKQSAAANAPAARPRVLADAGMRPSNISADRSVTLGVAAAPVVTSIRR